MSPDVNRDPEHPSRAVRRLTFKRDRFSNKILIEAYNPLAGTISMSETGLLWNQVAAHLAAATDKHVEAGEVRRDTTLQGDLGLSSLTVINLVLELEEKFGICIQEQDFKNTSTAGDITDMVEAKLAALR
jgi:acyl carrier protein